MRSLSLALIIVVQVVVLLAAATFVSSRFTDDTTSHNEVPTLPTLSEVDFGQGEVTDSTINDTAGRFEEITKVLNELTR